MSRLLAEAHLGLIFQNDNFLALAFPLRGSHYLGSRHCGGAYHYLVAIANEQNPRQFYAIALGDAQTVNVYNLPRRYPVLLAANLNNSVNLKPPKLKYFTN